MSNAYITTKTDQRPLLMTSSRRQRHKINGEDAAPLELKSLIAHVRTFPSVIQPYSLETWGRRAL